MKRALKNVKEGKVERDGHSDDTVVQKINSYDLFLEARRGGCRDMAADWFFILKLISIMNPL